MFNVSLCNEINQELRRDMSIFVLGIQRSGRKTREDFHGGSQCPK